MTALSQPPASVPGKLAGKVGLVVGIANGHSIAVGCAARFAQAGATVAATYLNDAARPYVAAVADGLPCALLMPCDVRTEGSPEAVFDAIRAQFGRLDFLLHAHRVRTARGSAWARDGLLRGRVHAGDGRLVPSTMSAPWRHSWSAMTPG